MSLRGEGWRLLEQGLLTDNQGTIQAAVQKQLAAQAIVRSLNAASQKARKQP